MNAATYEAIESLRLVACSECGCRYAVAESLLAVAATLHCPHGHIWTPGVDSNAPGTIVNLLTALADAQARLAAARLRIEALTPLGEPSSGDLLRRSRLLAEHAEGSGQSKAVCPYCGASKGRGRLAEHIRRRHRQLLVEGGTAGGVQAT